MNYAQLLARYKMLLEENQKLKMEIDFLKEQINAGKDFVIDVNTAQDSIINVTPLYSTALVNNHSTSKEKVDFFMSLFGGRTDIYAKRWENPHKGTSGYSPVCGNEWKAGVCFKPCVKCSDCGNKNYVPLDDSVVESHLRGNIIAGIYPMCHDEKCFFLAMDFDDGEWQKDITALREACMQHNIPIAVERSRSGEGGHIWFFFEEPVPSALARRFGSALLTNSMSRRHEIAFSSYDRLFPNQDTMPKGGFGNLIALPLQKAAREKNNSVFVDEDFQPYPDQWEFLSLLQKLTDNDLESVINKLCPGSELGALKAGEEELTEKPWEPRQLSFVQDDFPAFVEIIKSNMLYVPKAGFSPGALNHLKRFAAFKNPEFYKSQAMRLPTYNKPRIISCSEETPDYLCLPRGCQQDVQDFLIRAGVEVKWSDKSNLGRKIDVSFNGILRDDQAMALEKLVNQENGILCGTTAFGKTVVAISLIAKKKVNTLIIVDKVSLVSQWKERLTKFLNINESLPENNYGGGKRRGRKKKVSLIGQKGNGKNALSGIIDIALMQSLNRMGEVHECVKDYGMIIIDECHHVSAFSFERVLAMANAKHVFGLTATPTRKDGHHPIIYMQCGPIRYRDDAKKQAEKRPFEHFIIPRFTSFRLPIDQEETDVSITEIYARIVEHEARTQQIVDDVIKCYEAGRNCLVLTERTAHVELLSNRLGKSIPDVISATGGRGRKESRETLSRITNAPLDRPLTLIATGRYIGEGFDEPRLDTLFLAMPISWKGTLQQYAGRLHRLFEGKNEVQIYDYVDIHVRMLQKMYFKRLNGYSAIGYKTKGELNNTENADFIYNKSSFLPVYSNDLMSATNEILIVSPFITKRRVNQMLTILEDPVNKRVKVTLLTRPAEDFPAKDRLLKEEMHNLLRDSGIIIVTKTKIHQKFAIIDQKIIWYGSINLMSFGTAEESIMRLESVNIAIELLNNLHEE